MKPTPETLAALDSIIAEHGELNEETAPKILVQLCKKLERERDEARAEIETMREVINQTYDMTEGYADGAPDATAHDKLCNEISSKLKPFIKP